MSTSRPLVLCFGEILWDFLPEGLFAGGAPFNVAHHLHGHGCEAWPVSAVGADVLGDELLRRLRDQGLPTGAIHRAEGRRTGFVRATIGPAGDARYEIVADVAWDAIPASAEALALAARADAFVFGSLALRSGFNADGLDRFLAALPPRALRVFDVNLRAPHDDLALVRRLAKRATLLKLNREEAARLATAIGERSDSPEDHARALARDAGVATVCITGGAHGAGLLTADRWHEEAGRSVAVADTIGAGDGFLASLVSSLLRDPGDPPGALARACRLGEWISTRRGATPRYTGDTPLEPPPRP